MMPYEIKRILIRLNILKMLETFGAGGGNHREAV
jgi:hypothetical protein